MNYYEILGLDPTASQEEIRRAYRTLAKERHPDAGGTERVFRMLNAAYDILRDPESRASYDQDMEAAGTDGVVSGEDGVAGFDFEQLVGQPAAEVIKYLESVGIYPSIEPVPVTDPRLDGKIVAADTASRTLSVGVTRRTAGYFAALGIAALQFAWEITKLGATKAGEAVDSGLKQLEAHRDSGPSHDLPRPMQPVGCMRSLYVLYVLLAVLILAVGSIGGGARLLLLILLLVLMAPFAISIGASRAAKRAYYRQTGR